MLLITAVVWLVLVAPSSQSLSLHDAKVYRRDGDLIIGGFVPLHFYNDSTRLCEELREVDALRMVEAVRYAVTMINEDDDLLANITLGFEIYDSCSSPDETLKQVLNLVPGVRNMNDVPDNIIGVVGPKRSANSIEATNVLGLYNISTVSYLSTSDELSDNKRFPFFLRTVPPDRFQVSVITDILRKYQWEYVAFVYEDDSYGKHADAEFREQAEKNNICVGYRRGISTLDESRDYDELIADLIQLRQESLISVVIIFALPETVIRVFEQAEKANVNRDFIWIGSDGWGTGLTLVNGREETAVGKKRSGFQYSYQCIYHRSKAEVHFGFNRYFETVLRDNSSNNPWLPEYSQKYTHASILEVPEPSYDSLVIDAVQVISRGLHNMREMLCKGLTHDVCLKTILANRRLLRDYLLNTSFTSDSNGLISFSKDGDPIGRYNIRYLSEMDGSYQFTTEGRWVEYEDPKLVLQPVAWYLKEEKKATGERYTDDGVPKSVCSDPCTDLQVSRPLRDCCWSCVTCEDNAIIKDNECSPCFSENDRAFQWPHPSLTHCVDLDSIRPAEEVGNVVLLTVALLGIVAEAVVSVFYVRNRRTKLIKASSRELSYIVLIGIFLGYVSAGLHCIPASVVTCYLRRIIPSVATTYIYVPLLVMTIRLYRIFSAGEKTANRPKFISQSSQVILTLAISIIPVVWALVWIVLHPPNAVTIPPSAERQILEQKCEASKVHSVGVLSWEIIIVLVTCYIAFRTRNLPANYNQTRFIAFSVFSSLVVQIAFAPAFFTTDVSSQQDLYIALGFIIQPTVVLMLIFSAKVYAIYFVNEEDQQVIANRPSVRYSSQSVLVKTVSCSVTSGPGLTNPTWCNSDYHLDDVFEHPREDADPRSPKPPQTGQVSKLHRKDTDLSPNGCGSFKPSHTSEVLNGAPNVTVRTPPEQYCYEDEIFDDGIEVII